MRLAPNRMLVAGALAALALVAAGCGEGSTAAPETATQSAPAEAGSRPSASVSLLPPTEARELIDGGDVRVLDVRTPEEFAEGHVAGATLIDFYEPDFAQRLAQLDRDATYVVYCRSGNRSSQATTLMAEQGFEAVNDVDGGVVAWQAAGLPLVRGAAG